MHIHDLALNNFKKLIYRKTQSNKQRGLCLFLYAFHILLLYRTVYEYFIWWGIFLYSLQHYLYIFIKCSCTYKSA